MNRNDPSDTWQVPTQLPPFDATPMPPKYRRYFYECRSVPMCAFRAYSMATPQASYPEANSRLAACAVLALLGGKPHLARKATIEPSGAIASRTQGLGGVPRDPRTGSSISRRMMLISTPLIAFLLFLLLDGGLLLNQTLTASVTHSYDEQLASLLNSIITSAELGPNGEVINNRELADQRFSEPNSGVYWQVTGKGYEPYKSRSLWDRTLRSDQSHDDREIHFYDSDEFAGSTVVLKSETGDLSKQALRVAERDVTLPGSPVRWRFQIAQSRETLNKQLTPIQDTLFQYFAKLGLAVVVMVGLQTWFGLLPLRKVRSAIQRMRTGKSRCFEGRTPSEISPLVEELNILVDHNDRQAEEARRHAGNLAHALKTPLSVVVNAAAAGQNDLAATVLTEAHKMSRQIDHHLTRSRAVGRRVTARCRAQVWPSIEAVERAVAQLYPGVRIDVDGQKDLIAHIERQDLDDLLGNLVENAAQYGGGSVFITAGVQAGFVEISVEDSGAGIPKADRVRILDRGVRLDSSKQGSGMGLSIVRDVVEIYGGTVNLEESEDLGGLLVLLRLPMAS